MEPYVFVNLIAGLIWSYVVVLWILGGKEMSFIREVVIGVLPAVITGFVTFAVMKKTQVTRLTEEIKSLSKDYAEQIRRIHDLELENDRLRQKLKTLEKEPQVNMNLDEKDIGSDWDINCKGE